MSVFDHLADIPGQVNASVMYAGAVKAWHRHARQEDNWTVLRGNLKIGLFNTGPETLAAELRLATPAPNGELQRTLEVAPNSGAAVFLGEHRPGVLRIPIGMWHGGVAVGGQDALLLYYVTRKYDPAAPDEERAAWDAFDFAWNIEFK
jgi:dTDP-4-dehydrorhamnose 3,5-epimerase